MFVGSSVSRTMGGVQKCLVQKEGQQLGLHC